MKLNISLNPAKSRNIIPDIIATKALFYGLDADLPALSDKAEYLVIVILMYIVLSLAANVIANIIGMIRGNKNESEANITGN